MRLPSHIVLDFERTAKRNENWYNEFMLQKKTYDNIFLLLSIDRKFLPRSPKKSSFLSKKDKYTLK